MTEKPLSDRERRRLLNGSQLGHQRACDRALALLDQQAADLERANGLAEWRAAEIRRQDRLLGHGCAGADEVSKLKQRLHDATALLVRVQMRGPTRGDGALNGDINAFLGWAGLLSTNDTPATDSAEAVLDQVRLHCTLNTLAAFEPATDDQATNAGRFSVALYLLKQIHAAMFPTGGTRGR